ncbi:hypothetical protein [Marinicrinis sediminis]|uniref:Lipoprotein n=1 Tax=Marinicrinis sediminis TaxID=1652465 RepID=A0ABW5RCK6_9BACL
MQKKFKFPLFMIAAILLVMVAACNQQDDKIKEEVMEALEAYEASSHQQFDGELRSSVQADLQTPSALSSLLPFLKDANMQLEGKRTDDPLQLEATVSMQLGDLGLEMPVQVKEQKVYFQLPMLGQSDMNYSLDLDPDVSAQALQMDDILAELLQTLFTEIDAKHFEVLTQEQENDQELADRTIALVLEEEDKLALMLDMNEALPGLLDVLVNKQWITEQQSEQWQSYLTQESSIQYLRDITFNEPGHLAVTLNEQKNISGFHLKLDVTDHRDQVQQFELDYSVDNLDQAPSFDQSVPEDALRFEDILRLLSSESSESTQE